MAVLRKIRIGTDITLGITVMASGHAVDWDSQDIKHVYAFSDVQGQPVAEMSYEQRGSTLRCVFHAEDQNYVGAYRVIIEFNDGSAFSSTLDMPAFEIVRTSEEADIDTGEIVLDIDGSMRFYSLAEVISKLEGLHTEVKAAASAAREASDNANAAAKKANDAAALANSNASKAEASNKVINDNERKRIAQETARESAEAERKRAELERQKGDESIANKEAERERNEEVRETNEQTREDNELERRNAESARNRAESQRATSETKRISNETSRQAAENKRVAAETSRQEAETSRVNVESERVTEFARLKKESEEATKAASAVSDVVADHTAKIENLEKKTKIENIKDADLGFVDEQGNVLVKFEKGHIRTKEFNSEEAIKKGEMPEFPATAHFTFSTALLAMDDELAGFDANEKDSLGCATFPNQIFAKIDKLVEECPLLLKKMDAAEFAGLEYPVYTKLGGAASGGYIATPSYTTPIYHFVDNSISIDKKKQTIFIVAGIHGWENASQFNTYVLLSKLCRCASPDYMALRSSIDLYIIPCVNMYGAYHSFSNKIQPRKNANQVDINRNFPIEGWTVIGDISSINYSGQSPASEFETQMIINIARKITPDIMIDHHSYGSFVDYNFYQEYSTKLGRTLGVQNLYAWTAQGCLSFPEHYGKNCKLHPDHISIINNEQTCQGWAKYVGIADSDTIEVSIGIGFKNGERYANLSEYLAADTEWKAPSIMMNELALRLTLMKYVYFHQIYNIYTNKTL